MRIIVIGAVAAGTSAATKARRNNDNAEIVIYEKDKDISYSGCGLPYYIGGEISDVGELTPRDSAFFKKKYNIDIFTGHEVLKIHSDKKEVTVKNLLTNEIFNDSYDELVIGTGAVPFVPTVEGIDKSHVFFLRNVQSARNIRNFITTNKPKKAIIAGTGFIGFEMLENLMDDGISVTVVEKQNQITPNLDEDMAAYLESQLIKKNITIIKDNSIVKIDEDSATLEDGTIVESEMIIMATGVRPNVALAKEAGVEIGVTGAIKVDKKMKTNVDHIYACGDCIETYSQITGKSVYRPLGSTANKTGRIAGDVLTGGTLEYRGNLGTGIFKLFNMAIANTGLSEREAIKEGYDVLVCHNIKPDKAAYFNGTEMVIKAIADKKSERILGVQIVGYEGVDKRIDVFATLITYGAKVDELFHLDLAYAPPFSTTKDPVHYTGMILDNALNKNIPIKTSNEIRQLIHKDKKVQIIDARVEKQYGESHVDTAMNIPHAKLREKMKTLDKDVTTITYCNKGVTGNAAQNILLNHGFKEVYNLSGGHRFYKGTKKK
ncbi:FAD-dependent oxidoreductase [Anaeromicrobium sediminis]|uniref:Dehydrogenase n=1 Tax=Anaeromicrobium sediminis TaxID=1478221 RepID=A0A267MG04_9FIRM|nr:FAD-dependent oxidoreductase [Anaeromicrobium sediminis]PAB57838.1 dehydrogenase [Anaeromicrobium sediminis]